MATPLDPQAVKARRRGRVVLIFLALLFLGPMMFSLGYHQLGFRWHPSPKTAGLLLDPPQPVGLSRPAAGAPGWRLVYVGHGACAQVCLDQLGLVRRVRTALGRHADKFALLYVPDGNTGNPPPVPDVKVVNDPDGALRAQLLALGGGGRVMLYVVDPLGYALLQYPPTVPGKALLGDLKRIVRRFGGD